MVVTGSADHTIRVWTIDSSDCIATLEGHESVVNHLVCDGRFIMSTSYDKTARVWSLYNEEDKFCVQFLEVYRKVI